MKLTAFTLHAAAYCLVQICKQKSDAAAVCFACFIAGYHEYPVKLEVYGQDGAGTLYPRLLCLLLLARRGHFPDPIGLFRVLLSLQDCLMERKRSVH